MKPIIEVAKNADKSNKDITVVDASIIHDYRDEDIKKTVVSYSVRELDDKEVSNIADRLFSYNYAIRPIDNKEEVEPYKEQIIEKILEFMQKEKEKEKAETAVENDEVEEERD